MNWRCAEVVPTVPEDRLTLQTTQMIHSPPDCLGFFLFFFAVRHLTGAADGCRRVSLVCWKVQGEMFEVGSRPAYKHTLTTLHSSG